MRWDELWSSHLVVKLLYLKDEKKPATQKVEGSIVEK